ncbi:unnamed protein product [Pieris macdunnoughi]|uniref:UDP-glucuronosyltransferase n=1 Tax=Pieris macdunnoughi TaxID=345717 RepID=A0A821XD34_9NEOP|nr:unnamed protein product [Pieris macdunnoughi]
MFLPKVVITLLFFSMATKAARILAFFPFPSISHQYVFRPLTLELSRRGHDVTVVTTDPRFAPGTSPENFTEIDVHEISYNIFQKIINSHTGEENKSLFYIKLMMELLTDVLKAQLQVPEVKRLLKEKFDLLIVEAVVTQALALGHILNVPIIQISSLGSVPYQFRDMSGPVHPLLYPSCLSFKIHNTSIYDQLMEYDRYIKLYDIFITSQYNEIHALRRYFGNDLPPYEELVKRVQLLFLNEHPIWGHNRPIPRNLVYIGGIHQRPEKEISKELKTFLNSSSNGVIYVSFGTSIKTSALPSEKVQIMANVLSKLPYNVLWRFTEDTVPIQSKNIKFSKWFPQPDLLKHPNVKLFITQGGLQSTEEAINAGVPLVGFPILGDQWYNAQNYLVHKIGLQLNIMTLTEEAFRHSVETVISDKSYKENILKLKQRMRDCPVKPLDSAVWWVEHILRHGSSHLQSFAVGRTSISEYYESTLVLLCLPLRDSAE